MLKKSINDQLAYENKYNEQLSQYEVMKNKAFNAFMTRKALLEKMISFENLTMIKNGIEFDDMQKVYHELEDQVKLIKSETLEMEYKLNIIQEDVVKKEKYVLDYKQKNNIVINDRNLFLKDYFRENIKLIKIYSSLNVFSTIDIIEIFNREKFNYQSNYTQFNNLNKEIVDLNIIYTTYERDLHTVVKNIQSKEEKDLNNYDYKSDIDVINVELQLKESRESIEEDIEKIGSLEKIFIKLKKNFNSNDKRLNQIINSINYLNSLKYKEKENKEVRISSKEVPGISSNSQTINNLVQIKDLMSNENEWSEQNCIIYFILFKIAIFYLYIYSICYFQTYFINF